MIRHNDFNSAWWGAPVGFVSDLAFFEQSPEAIAAALRPFAWVEYRAAYAAAPSPVHLARFGFVEWDVQMRFRIGLGRREWSASALKLTARTLSVASLEFGASADFVYERFTALPGMTPSRLKARYETWARALVERAPDNCLEVFSDGVPQGWFLAEAGARGLHLALAMLRRDATVTGRHLYERALATYAERGHAVGWAAFSARNTPVLNIYSSLGAVFTPPEGQWVWLPTTPPETALARQS